MQIVSNGDNLHEVSKPIFWKKKYEKYIIIIFFFFFLLLSPELVQRVVKFKINLFEQ